MTLWPGLGITPSIKQLPPFAGCKNGVNRDCPELKYSYGFASSLPFASDWCGGMPRGHARAWCLLTWIKPCHYIFFLCPQKWYDPVGWEPWAWKILCQFVIPIIARLSIALLLTSEYFNNGEASMKHVVSVSHVVAAYKMTYLPWRKDRGSTEWNHCDKAYP